MTHKEVEYKMRELKLETENKMLRDRNEVLESCICNIDAIIDSLDEYYQNQIGDVEYSYEKITDDNGWLEAIMRQILIVKGYLNG
jgi:hypothetical protein